MGQITATSNLETGTSVNPLYPGQLNQMPTGFVPLTSAIVNGESTTKAPVSLESLSAHLPKPEPELKSEPSLEALAAQHSIETTNDSATNFEANTDIQASGQFDYTSNPIPSFGYFNLNPAQILPQGQRLTPTQASSAFEYQQPQQSYSQQPVAPTTFSLPSQLPQPTAIFQTPQTIQNTKPNNFTEFVYQPSVSEQTSFNQNLNNLQAGGIDRTLAKTIPNIPNPNNIPSDSGIQSSKPGETTKKPNQNNPKPNDGGSTKSPEKEKVKTQAPSNWLQNAKPGNSLSIADLQKKAKEIRLSNRQ